VLADQISKLVKESPTVTTLSYSLRPCNILFALPSSLIYADSVWRSYKLDLTSDCKHPIGCNVALGDLFKGKLICTVKGSNFRKIPPKD